MAPDDRYRIIPGVPPLANLLPDALGPYLGLLIAGFLVGWYGHGLRSNWLVALGILLILAAVVLLQVAISSEDGRTPPGF
jgi:hypothetical protein